MKYTCGLMTTKLLIILHCCKSNICRNFWRIGRVTVTLFNIQNTAHRRKKKVEKFVLHLAAEFLCERNNWIRQK